MFYVMGWGMGVGWRLPPKPTPIPHPCKEYVIICHSERSEESTVFYRTTMIEIEEFFYIIGKIKNNH